MVKIFHKLAFFLSLLYVDYAFGFGDLVWDPENIAQTTITANNSVTELTNQAAQISNELKNLKNYQGNQTQWSDTSMLLNKLSDVIKKGQAISYGMQDVDEQFKRKYPGYKAQTNYSSAYQSWSSTTSDTLQNTLQSSGLQANDFTNEQDRLNMLKQLSTSSEGRMQAVQVGNMIASEEVGQTQKLRQLVISQTNAQNAYMAYQVQKDASSQAAEENMFKTPKPYPKYGSGEGFGSDSVPHLSN